MPATRHSPISTQITIKLTLLMMIKFCFIHRMPKKSILLPQSSRSLIWWTLTRSQYATTYQREANKTRHLRRRESWKRMRSLTTRWSRTHRVTKLRSNQDHSIQRADLLSTRCRNNLYCRPSPTSQTSQTRFQRSSITLTHMLPSKMFTTSSQWTSNLRASLNQESLNRNQSNCVPMNLHRIENCLCP